MRSTAEGTHPGEAARGGCRRNGTLPRETVLLGAGRISRRLSQGFLVECYFGTILHLVFFGVMRTVGALASAFLF